MRMPAYKTLSVYDRPWWKDSGSLRAGRRPICQYAKSTTCIPGTTNIPAEIPKSLMLATYADGRTQSFWNALYQGQKS